MTANRRLPLISIRTSALIVLLLSVTACSKTVEWSEEVQLSTGQTIVIERETRHRPGGGEIFRSSGWRPELYIIRFKHNYPPRHGLFEVEWRTTKWDAEHAMEPEKPLMFDVEPGKGTPFIITIHALRGACFEYVRYAFRDGGWYENPLPAEFEPREANLYIAGAALDIPRQVSLKEKRAALDNFQYSMRFKKIGPKQTDCRA